MSLRPDWLKALLRPYTRLVRERFDQNLLCSGVVRTAGRIAKGSESGIFDAVIALGVVIRGETPHFDYVAGQAAAGIMQASMQTGVPVMFGVITAERTTR